MLRDRERSSTDCWPPTDRSTGGPAIRPSRRSCARRIFSRLGLTPAVDTYVAWQRLFTRELPPDAALFNEYHALIVAHAKLVCRTVPLCEGCVLLDICPVGRRNVAERL